ncbi:CA074 protein, partial [Xiphorhynchus elegans]|nr:CA074 protein [Xiphorhynchus elegans]
LSPPLLVAAARDALGRGMKARMKKSRRLPAARALQLAGEVLAVCAGLKPAVLCECGAAGPAGLRRYLRGLRDAGLAPLRIHLLGLGGSALLLHPRLARCRMEGMLRARPAPFVDVSSGRRCPEMCGEEEAEGIRSQLASLLDHLRDAEATSAEAVSCSEVVAEGWDLCAVLGVLLGYPAVYTFSREGGEENCLALTPLRVFTVHASCPRIKDGLRIQIYSFSIPESLCPQLGGVLDAWCAELKEAFSAQSDFVDLCISSEVVSLPVVAL